MRGLSDAHDVVALSDESGAGTSIRSVPDELCSRALESYVTGTGAGVSAAGNFNNDSAFSFIQTCCSHEPEPCC